MTISSLNTTTTLSSNSSSNSQVPMTLTSIRTMQLIAAQAQVSSFTKSKMLTWLNKNPLSRQNRLSLSKLRKRRIWVVFLCLSWLREGPYPWSQRPGRRKRMLKITNRPRIITISKTFPIKLNTKIQTVNTTTNRTITISNNSGITISRIRTITSQQLIKTLTITTKLSPWILQKLTK